MSNKKTILLIFDDWLANSKAVSDGTNIFFAA